MSRIMRPYGTALITFDSWKQSSSNSLIVYDSEKTLDVNIKIIGSDFKIQPEIITEDVSARKKPTRIGINLTEPVEHAQICLTISPKD